MSAITIAQTLSFFNGTDRTITRIRKDIANRQVTFHFSSDTNEEKHYKVFDNGYGFLTAQHGLSGNFPALSDSDIAIFNTVLKELHAEFLDSMEGSMYIAA